MSHCLIHLELPAIDTTHSCCSFPSNFPGRMLSISDPPKQKGPKIFAAKLRLTVATRRDTFLGLGWLPRLVETAWCFLCVFVYKSKKAPCLTVVEWMVKWVMLWCEVLHESKLEIIWNPPFKKPTKKTAKPEFKWINELFLVLEESKGSIFHHAFCWKEYTPEKLRFWTCKYTLQTGETSTQTTNFAGSSLFLVGLQLAKLILCHWPCKKHRFIW